MTVSDWLGREIASSEGMRYGRLDEVFVARESGEPELGIVTVARPGAEGTKRVAVPLDAATLHGDVVVLPLDPARVKAAPEIQGEVDSVPPESAARVRAFFGARDEAPTRPMPPVGGPAAPPAPSTQPTQPMPSMSPQDETVVSEERLDVTTERRPAEIVRLRKQVVTEEVTVTVELRREELVIERETIPRDAVVGPDPAAFEDETEAVIVLHAEEPVVGRRVVPVERVRLRRDNVVERVDITETVRKEQVEAEHTANPQEP